MLWVGGIFLQSRLKRNCSGYLFPGFGDWGNRMKDKSKLRENPCRPTVDGPSCGPIGPTLVWPKAILFGQLWYLYKTMAVWPPFRSRSHQSPLWEIVPLGSQVSILFLQKWRFDVNMFLINQRFYTWSSPFILNLKYKKKT